MPVRENQIYTGAVIFGVESFKVFKRSRKPTAEKSITETLRRNVRFLSWRTFFVRKYSIQSTNEMAFKHVNRIVTLRDFPPSDLMLLRYFRSADARMRTQNGLLFAVCIL